MIQKIACIALLIALSYGATAQSKETGKKRYGRPDLPGTFVMELGFNRGIGAPSNFSLGLLGSRTLNIYYQYDIRILKSRFSLVPGIGFSLERFKFKNNGVLAYNSAASDSLQIVTALQAGVPGLKKSQLITNYLDIPVEIRYSSNPDDPGRSFKLSAGARIGYMFDSFTKVKYKDDGEKKHLKDKQNFDLTRIRYGLFGKIGIGNFSVFTYYNMTPLFKTGKGPGQKGIVTDFNTFTVGISLASF
jgi:hypothetical protein